MAEREKAATAQTEAEEIVGIADNDEDKVATCFAHCF